MLKSKNIKGAVAIALLTLIGVARKPLGEPHAIKSKDGKYEIPVPANMTESPSLNKDAQLTAANRPNELYVFVLTNKKSDYADGQTLDQHAEILRDALLKQLTDGDASTLENIVISGREARRYRVTGIRDGVKLAYFMTIVESADHFHHIWAWTEGSRASANGPILYQIADSFRINQ